MKTALQKGTKQIEISETQVPYMISQGWERKETKAVATPAKALPPESTGDSK